MEATEGFGGGGHWRTALREGRAALSREHKFLLLVLGATSFFDGYDRGILTVALTDIRHSFGLTKSEASWAVGLLHLGTLPALFIARRADRVGRRTLLLYSIVGYTLATGLTAAAPNTASYVACQFVAKAFLNAEAAIVLTMAAEELPAKARGLGFGWLSMNSALGVGFGAILFGQVLSPLDLSWRWLYVIGLPPLVLIGWTRRRLPESRRFTAAQSTGDATGRDWRKVFTGERRRWLFLILLTTFFVEWATQAGVFVIDYLQDGRGLSTGTANLMLVAAGLPGIPLMIAAGALSDRLGRRVVGCGFVVVSMVGALGFFWLPGGIPVLLPFMALTLVGQLGSAPVLGGYTAELFPTSVRSLAVSATSVSRVAGQSVSFGLAGILLALSHQSQPLTATLLGIGPVIALLIYWFGFPDTHGRELEDVGKEDPGPVATETVTGPVLPSAGD